MKMVVFAALAGAMVVACQVSQQPTMPAGPGGAYDETSTDGGDEGFLVQELDCRASPAQCAKLDQAITYLELRPDATCRQLGHQLRGRFNAAPGSGQGFKAITGTGPWSMSVVMVTNPSTLSGWAPKNGYINVKNGGDWESASVQDLGGLLAHEEGGHMSGEDCDGPQCLGDPFQNTGRANSFQALCSMEY